MTKTTMIDCPSCSGQGGAGTYCEDCQCTGSVSVPTNVAEHFAWLEKHATAETQRAEAAEAELRESERDLADMAANSNRLHAIAEQMRQRAIAANANLHLAYQVYRDVGGKVGSNSIFTFGEWLAWLATQTDELLDPQEAQP